MRAYPSGRQERGTSHQLSWPLRVPSGIQLAAQRQSAAERRAPPPEQWLLPEESIRLESVVACTEQAQILDGMLASVRERNDVIDL